MSYENDLVYVSGSRRIDVLPTTRSIGLEVANAAERAGKDLVRLIGATTWPDHDNLRCLDLVGGLGLQVWVRDYLIDNAARLGVELIINQRRIWRSYAKRDRGVDYPANSWAPYHGSSNPHTDHVHVQVADAPYTAPKAAPSANGVPGWWHVTADELRGRSGPSSKAEVVQLRPQGFNIWADHQVGGDGRVWLVTTHDTHYAREFCAPGKA